MEPTTQQESIQESFFDRNITVIVMLTGLIPFILPVYFMLALVNFHGKRGEIMRGMFATIALGFMLYVLVFVGIGMSSGH